MSYQELPIDTLLERVAEMPDIEAEQELILRKEGFALEMSMLQTELHKLEGHGTKSKKTKAQQEIGRALSVIGNDQTRLNAALKLLRQRLEAKRWSNAVMAVCGAEAWAECRVWMAAQDGVALAIDASGNFYRSSL